MPVRVESGGRLQLQCSADGGAVYPFELSAGSLASCRAPTTSRSWRGNEPTQSASFCRLVMLTAGHVVGESVDMKGGDEGAPRAALGGEARVVPYSPPSQRSMGATPAPAVNASGVAQLRPSETQAELHGSECKSTSAVMPRAPSR